jgi:membrane dipeptidase
MRKLLIVIAALLCAGILMAQTPPKKKATGAASSAAAVHASAIVVDTHADTPQRLLDEPFDLATDTPVSEGHLDFGKAKAGNLGAEFFSIWVEPEANKGHYAKRALELIDSVYQQAEKHSDQMVMAFSAADIVNARTGPKKRFAALLGVEGGHAIENSLPVLRDFYRLGVRYMTLTWSNTNEWADSSGDITDEKIPHHNGLTPFGKEVVREMNRLGMMIDVSHVSDKTFFDTMLISRAPVIASHSSSRALTNHPRNMTDDMLRALAKNGGVVMINYNAGFLSEEFRIASEKRNGNIVAAMAAMSKKCGGNEACTTMEGERLDHEAMAKGELPKVSWEKIIDHIDHAVKAAGIDHVGLGSDFDGATMPLGLEDVSKLPKITDALLNKGYSERDVEKILGGNILRVMEQVEKLRTGAP